ncbi:CU044_5270 family protein [Dactylosporangium sp. NPDC051484]|uniref:CU044_5270 family protein n=1 Tax=Dactylosporangium sp. NPDC051484 TaxID=3154942 RepID=UPI00344F366F
MNDGHAELVRLLPDPAQHDLSEDRQQVLRDRFMQQLDDPRAARAAVRGTRRRRRWALVPATAAALVVALWTVSAVSLGVGRFWAGNTEAGGLLDRIALVAASSNDIPRADQVRDDQFEFVETYGSYMNYTTGPDGKTTAALGKPHRRQIWKSVNGGPGGLLRDPDGSDDVPNIISGGESLNAPSFRYLTTLPTNPDLLLAKIYLKTFGAGTSPQQEAFVTIGDLMRESVVPAKLARTLYEAAARIPGVTVIDDSVDALGRHGIAVAHTDGGNRTEWIFDRTTLRFLGVRGVAVEAGDWGPAGTVTASTAVVARAIVDKAGQTPA